MNLLDINPRLANISCMIDLNNKPWEHRNGRFYISGTDQEFILVLWRGIKDSETDSVIKRHNEGLALKEKI
jgi:hypothetical protein